MELTSCPFHIRRASNNDAEHVAACVNAAYRHYIQRLGKPPGPMLDDYRDVIVKHQVFVAERDNTIVGLMVLMRAENSILLDNVAVHPDCQGQGLGHALIDLAEAEARKQGFKTLDLYTHEKMTENVAMYKKLGYEITGNRTVKGYQRIYMAKRLEPEALD